MGDVYVRAHGNGRAALTNDGQPVHGRPRRNQQLLNLLAAQRENLIEALVDGALASRGDGARADVDQLRVSMGEVFDIFVACGSDDRNLNADELALFERIGRARCSEGVALDAVLEEFRAAFDRCYECLVDMMGYPPDAERVTALKKLTPTAIRLRDAAIEAIGNGHTARQQQITAASAAGAVGLLRALLDGDVRRLAIERSRHGLEANRQATLVMITGEVAPDTGERVPKLMEAVPGALAAQLQPGPSTHVVVLATVEGQQPPNLELLRTSVGGQTTIFAQPVAPFEQLGETYRWLVPRFRLVSVLADKHGHISRGQLNRCRLLADVSAPEAHRYVAGTLGPLLTRPAAETGRWRATLAALCQTDRVTGAAHQLRCDRTTVERHATRVADLTGLDARNPEDRKDLALALILLDIHRHSLPPVGDQEWSRPACH